MFRKFFKIIISLKSIFLKIFFLCFTTKSNRACCRRLTSYIWNYYKKIAPGIARCCLCARKLKNNFYRHLKLRHPKAYIQYEKRTTTRLCKLNEGKVLNGQGGGRLYSWTRKYYTKINDIFLKCNICEAQMKTHGTNGNMHRHIRIKHPYIYFHEKDSKKSFNCHNPDSDAKEKKFITEVFYIKNIDNTDTSNIKDTGILAENFEDNHEVTNDENIESVIKAYDKDDFADDKVELSLTDPDLNCKIKALCERAIIGKRQLKSCVWNFFNMIEINRLYECGFCQQLVAIFPQSLSNMRRHIANKHSKQYEIIKKYDNSSVRRKIIPEIKDIQSDEITFLDLENNGQFKCLRCESIIECLDSEQEAFINHITECQPNVKSSSVDENVLNKTQTSDNDSTAPAPTTTEDLEV